MKPIAVVVGGSIAGVSCAHTLILAGWDVVVLEKTCGPIKGSPTGAGLSLDPLAPRLIQSWLDDPELLYSSTLLPTIDMMLMLKGCGGFPLALEVIDGSFRGQSAKVQLSRLRKWSIDDIISNIDLHKCLQRSLEFSGPEIKFKKFFMDLGSFPEDRRTYAAALIAMWAELYNLGEDGVDAIAILQELNIRHLASLLMTTYGDFLFQ